MAEYATSGYSVTHLDKHGKMMQQKRSDSEIQAAVKAQFIGIVPERTEDLERLWSEYNLQFSLLADEKEIVMEAGAYRYVHFNHRALRVIWVSAFAAWEAFRCSANAVNEGKVRDHQRLRELLDLALAVRDAPDPELVPLCGVPEPGTFPDGKIESELRAASELAVFASGWAMLHEVRHLQHQQQGTSSGADSSPEMQRAEELSCDKFATEYLLAEVPMYASASGQDLALIRRKRGVGIYFALFALTVLAHDSWGAGKSHPSVQTRLNNARAQVSGLEVDDALSIAALAFSSLEDVWQGAPALEVGQTLPLA